MQQNIFQAVGNKDLKELALFAAPQPGDAQVKMQNLKKTPLKAFDEIFWKTIL